MEKCISVDKIFTQTEKEFTENLKKKLKLLHFFRIVHLDIKPMNIMYSTQKEELVFIDFGFSRVLKEEIGEKSLTTFSGSAFFCSP